MPTARIKNVIFLLFHCFFCYAKQVYKRSAFPFFVPQSPLCLEYTQKKLLSFCFPPQIAKKRESFHHVIEKSKSVFLFLVCFLNGRNGNGHASSRQDIWSLMIHFIHQIRRIKGYLFFSWYYLFLCRFINLFRACKKDQPP